MNLLMNFHQTTLAEADTYHLFSVLTHSYLTSSQASQLSRLNCATLLKQASTPHLHQQY